MQIYAPEKAKLNNFKMLHKICLYVIRNSQKVKNQTKHWKFCQFHEKISRTKAFLNKQVDDSLKKVTRKNFLTSKLLIYGKKKCQKIFFSQLLAHVRNLC